MDLVDVGFEILEFGTEKAALPPSGSGAVDEMSRFSSRLTSGLSSTPRTSVKMAALARDAKRQREDHDGRQPFATHQRVVRNVLDPGKNDMLVAPSAFVSITRANRTPTL